jgi:hypothetical protein
MGKLRFYIYCREFPSHAPQKEERVFFMAKYLIQIIVLGTQAVGKAFAKAVRQEYQVKATPTHSSPSTL